MKVYIDSNIVIARTMAGHSHQPAATQLFREIRAHRWKPVISAHGLAEIYSVLTRAPLGRRISPAEAWLMIEQNILPLFEIEELGMADYSSLLRGLASDGLAGGQVYDAVHLQAARKAKCSKIYTFNVSDFRRIAPDLEDCILRP